MSDIIMPWAGKAESYAGWVPNVGSHLSFSVVESSARAIGYSRAVTGAPERLVLAIERRVANDFPWWTPLVSWQRPDLVLQWVMDARTGPTMVPVRSSDGTIEGKLDRQGMVVGRVHLLPTAQEEVGWKQEQTEAVGEIQRLLLTAPHYSSSAQLDVVQAAIVAEAHRVQGRIQVEFALMRTGELRLWFDDDGKAPDDEGDRYRVAEQAYYFIKDLVHDHEHHDPSSDQITPLTAIHTGKAPDPTHEPEIAWRRETLWSLSREIERLNREGGLVDLRKSLGVIAYAQSFQQVLMGHTRNSQNPTEFEPATHVYDYDFAHMKESIRATIDVLATKKTQLVQLALAGSATFLSALSVVSSLASSHNGGEPKTVKGAPVDVVTFHVGDPLVSILAYDPLLTALLAVVAVLMLAAWAPADGRAGIYTRSQRVIAQLSRAAAVSTSATARSQFVRHLLTMGTCLALTLLLVVALVYVLTLLL
jgi:hypothetical protein